MIVAGVASYQQAILVYAATPTSSNVSEHNSPDVSRQQLLVNRSLFYQTIRKDPNVQTKISGRTGRDFEELFDEGYNSDENEAPMNIGLTPEEYIEPTISSVGYYVPTTSDENNFDAGEVIIIEESEIMKMKVDEIRSELKKRALQMKGLKAELQER